MKTLKLISYVSSNALSWKSPFPPVSSTLTSSAFLPEPSPRLSQECLLDVGSVTDLFSVFFWQSQSRCSSTLKSPKSQPPIVLCDCIRSQHLPLVPASHCTMSLYPFIASSTGSIGHGHKRNWVSGGSILRNCLHTEGSKSKLYHSRSLRSWSHMENLLITSQRHGDLWHILYDT